MEVDGETVETVTYFIFLGSKITADGDCTHEIKTLAPWKESYDHPRQHIKKQAHYFTNKGPSSQSYGFSSSHVWMWELDYKESWAPKSLCFWTVVLEKTLESPLDCKEIQPVHKEISPEYSLERLMLKLKLQYFSHLMQRTNSQERTWCWEILKAGGEGGDTGWDGWMASLTWWTWVWASSGSWWWTGKPCQAAVRGVIESDMTEWLNWTELFCLIARSSSTLCDPTDCSSAVSLILTIPLSLLRFTSIESVMVPNHLIEYFHYILWKNNELFGQYNSNDHAIHTCTYMYV